MITTKITKYFHKGHKKLNLQGFLMYPLCLLSVLCG